MSSVKHVDRLILRCKKKNDWPYSSVIRVVRVTSSLVSKLVFKLKLVDVQQHVPELPNHRHEHIFSLFFSSFFCSFGICSVHPLVSISFFIFISIQISTSRQKQKKNLEKIRSSLLIVPDDFVVQVFHSISFVSIDSFDILVGRWKSFFVSHFDRSNERL